MIISIIVAMDERRGIGKDNRLPWRLRTDLQRFRHLTMGHHLISGRKTYESIEKTLPGRTMIVITRNKEYKPQDVLVAHSLSRALEIAGERGEEEVFIIGGSEIYRQALPITNRIYLTRVCTIVETDTTFPEINQEEWQISQGSFTPADKYNQYPHSYYVLSRIERVK